MFRKCTVISLLAVLYCVENAAYRGIITFPTEPSIIEECSFADDSRGKCVTNENCPVYHNISGLLTKDCTSSKFRNTVCCPNDVNSIKMHKIACYHQYPRPQDIPTGTAENPITGGLRIRPGEFPYVVALGYNTYNRVDGSHIEYRCGGVLIDELFVLATAQCLKAVPAVVLPGGLNINDTHAETHRIAHTYVHPDYIENQVYNDIGLIELQDPIWRFPPACLSDDQLTIGSRVTAMSYPHADNLFTRTVELSKSQINLISNEECFELFKAYPKIHKGIKNTQFCAKDEQVLQAKCKGDSGGPIMIDTGDNTRPFVVGMTSLFVKCSSKFPGIYTRVGPYIDWIESIVWPKYL